MSSMVEEPKFVPGLAIPQIPKIPVGGVKNDESIYYFPVNRIYCVGKNYSDHVKEMGGNPRNDAPCFFMKPSNAIVPCDRKIYSNNKEKAPSIAKIPYPLGTNNLHYEVELVVAIGNPEAGTNDGVNNVSIENAYKLIYGYGIGIDLTRRDLQMHAKKHGLPWCTSKGFDTSAPISNIYPITIPDIYNKLHIPLMNRKYDDVSGNDNNNEMTTTDQKTIPSTNMWLYVNGQLRQNTNPIHNMIWNISDIISQLSQLYTLRTGDIVYTGTPSGVSSIIPNDTIHAGMDLLGELEFILTPQQIQQHDEAPR